MTLTSTQLVTLKDHIVANTDQTVIDALAEGNNNAIRDWYNTDASPNFWVFRSFVSDMDLKESAIDWTEHLALTLVELAVFEKLIAGGGFNPENENVRNGLAAIFAGGFQANTRNAILDLAARLATEAETVFATTATGPAGGDGSAKTQAAIAVVEGNLSTQDIRDAVALIE